MKKPLLLIDSIKIQQGKSLKIIDDTQQCPHCGSAALQRVRRQGREDWVFDRVFLCDDCHQRSARVPAGNTTLVARFFVALRLV